MILWRWITSVVWRRAYRDEQRDADDAFAEWTREQIRSSSRAHDWYTDQYTERAKECEREDIARTLERLGGQ